MPAWHWLARLGIDPRGAAVATTGQMPCACAQMKGISAWRREGLTAMDEVDDRNAGQAISPSRTRHVSLNAAWDASQDEVRPWDRGVVIGARFAVIPRRLFENHGTEAT
jgi:hypothetical protein